MSTGDQTQYIRSKIAERGSTRGAHFMMDGFDRWAESEAPARAGQMEKIPAETQMESYGGAMTLSKAKRLQAMMGGKSVNVGGIQIEVPQFIEDGINVAKKMSVVVDWTSQKLPGFIEDLTDNIIDKPNDYAPGIIADAKQLLGILQTLRGWVASIKYILDIGKSIGGAFGMGRHGGKRLVGGDWASTFEKAKKTIEGLIQWYVWLKQKAAFLRAILDLESVKAAGGDQLLAKLEPILSAVGMGRHGSKHCCCDDSSSESEYDGGAQMVNYSPPMRVGPEMGRVVGSAKGNLTKLKSLLSHAPKLPGLPKMGGRKVGGRKHGGVSSAQMPEGFQHSLYSGMTPDYAIEKPGAHKVSQPFYQTMGGRKVGGRKVGGRASSGVYEPPPMRAHGPASGSLSGPVGGRKPSARGEIVKKVMREQGLSLPQASKFVKEHGLY